MGPLLSHGWLQSSSRRQRLGTSRSTCHKLSWDDIGQYLLWFSKKTGKKYCLPSEDEWEYAARASSSQPTEPPPLFNDDKLAWASDYVLAPRQLKKTKPVGSYAVNNFGVFGVKGNVWEWTGSCWQGVYAGTKAVGLRKQNCGLRILRGEHRSVMPTFVREIGTGGCSVRPLPGNFGFRVVRET